ncbi:hypothetical protein Q5Y75_23965 [Ruegeria sp. 2205SS24-7]|uniref:DUF6998 domain-containing protein n=1 Tax=Ruegeria discodermiae TaxID=3064389 RepID=UPI002740D950|nr:hypothetical protein [Ruegeria sp. 2205SS24-7]MDP5220251.1 hypothetical protein [Ruegeria sp. 2205SS24-7]
MPDVEWSRVAELIDQLYHSTDALERIFPGRKFTLDGHLVGSVGEVVASYMFNLTLNSASTMGHDARAQDGRKVEIKLTQGKSVAIRYKPEHLLVLSRPKGKLIRVVYNGEDFSMRAGVCGCDLLPGRPALENLHLSCHSSIIPDAAAAACIPAVLTSSSNFTPLPHEVFGLLKFRTHL